MQTIDKIWYMFGLKFRDHLEEQEYVEIKTPLLISFFTVRPLFQNFFDYFSNFDFQANSILGPPCNYHWDFDSLCCSILYQGSNASELHHNCSNSYCFGFPGFSKKGREIYRNLLDSLHDRHHCYPNNCLSRSSPSTNPK